MKFTHTGSYGLFIFGVPVNSVGRVFLRETIDALAEAVQVLGILGLD